MGAIVFCKTLFTFSEQLSALVLLRLWLVNEVRFVAQLSFLYILTQEFFWSMSQFCVKETTRGGFRDVVCVFAKKLSFKVEGFDKLL